MVKRSKRGAMNDAVIPRSMLPKDAERITTPQGNRVWMYKGMEFLTKRDLCANSFKAIQGPKPVEGTIDNCDLANIDIPDVATETITNDHIQGEI